MDSLFILIPIALLLVFIAVKIFLWAVRSGQFDDLDTEGKRILFDQESLDRNATGSEEEKGATKSPGEQKDGGDKE